MTAPIPVTDRWWPKFWPIRRRARLVSCSVCGAAVLDTYTDRGNHQLFHGWLWRLVAGDPNPINEEELRQLRAWLHTVDQP